MESTLEQRTMRKVALRIVPFIMLLYFIAYIDRVNIGFAALTMNKDLGFSPGVFGFGAGIFFLGLFSLRSTLEHHPRQGRRASFDCAGNGQPGLLPPRVGAFRGG